MPEPELIAEKARNKKRAIGAVAIILLLIFTVLALLGYIDLIIWVVADLVIAAVANLLLRRVGRITV